MLKVSLKGNDDKRRKIKKNTTKHPTQDRLEPGIKCLAGAEQLSHLICELRNICRSAKPAIIWRDRLRMQILG